MARSTYIYVVTQGVQAPVPFTVKHELATWLRQRDWLTGGYVVWRCDDGLHKRPPRLIPLKDLGLVRTP